jgi:hypothetical protein
MHVTKPSPSLSPSLSCSRSLSLSISPSRSLSFLPCAGRGGVVCEPAQQGRQDERFPRLRADLGTTAYRCESQSKTCRRPAILCRTTAIVSRRHQAPTNTFTDATANTLTDTSKHHHYPPRSSPLTPHPPLPPAGGTSGHGAGLRYRIRLHVRHRAGAC